MYKLFTYGSLRKGEWNHKYLEHSKFLGTGHLKGYYNTHSMGLPIIKEDEDSMCYGEIYEIDERTLNGIDRLEGNGHLYKRKLSDIMIDDESTISAIVYYPMDCLFEREKAWKNY